jgi:hypothetical protein
VEDRAAERDGRRWRRALFTGGGNVRYSWVAAAVPRPGRPTLVTCLLVICNFPDGTRGLKH